MKKFKCLPLKQGNYSLVVFSIPAKELFALVKINRREEDKRKGYQRTLLPGRPATIAKFIDEGNALPTNVVISFDKATLNENGTEISIEDSGDAGWVIDGQHRLAGASEAGSDIEVPVAAFIGLSLEEQIAQFVIINREAKRVPTSLYYDLLPELTKLKKSEADIAKETAVAMANAMKTDESSAFYLKIASLKAPAKGQISLTNFVRKIAPLVHATNGTLRTRTQKEQRAMIENYFGALGDIFPKVYSEPDSVFFRTLGFGALFNAFAVVNDLTLKRTHDSFTRADVAATLKEIADFDFSRWKKLGTGSGAETIAGTELINALRAAFPQDGDEGTLKV